jgi:hypothetical protein
MFIQTALLVCARHRAASMVIGGVEESPVSVHGGWNTDGSPSTTTTSIKGFPEHAAILPPHTEQASFCWLGTHQVTDHAVIERL